MPIHQTRRFPYHSYADDHAFSYPGAELTEAINSMFNYYRDAKLCIAYLSDVPSYRSQSKIHSRPDCLQSFKKSVWFSRGWTLQELLAPKHLDFYDRDFKFIGSRSNLSQLVSVVTGIDPKYLNGRSKLNEASVATRMSWASKRQTTRSEDEAYSLMGIFGVNMALLYGEGKRAFFRLQQQIIEYSDDESIFAWICPEAGNQEPFGMLAESPRNFQWSRDVYHVRVRTICLNELTLHQNEQQSSAVNSARLLGLLIIV